MYTSFAGQQYIFNLFVKKKYYLSIRGELQVQIRLKRAMWIEEHPAQRIRGIAIRNNEACRSTLIHASVGRTLYSSPTRWRVISKNLSITSTR